MDQDEINLHAKAAKKLKGVCSAKWCRVRVTGPALCNTCYAKRRYMKRIPLALGSMGWHYDVFTDFDDHD